MQLTISNVTTEELCDLSGFIKSEDNLVSNGRSSCQLVTLSNIRIDRANMGRNLNGRPILLDLEIIVHEENVSQPENMRSTFNRLWNCFRRFQVQAELRCSLD
jgi:hypothetical protein